MSDQLCTLAQVKARVFPNGVTDTGDDTLIGELIDEVSAWIESYTGRTFIGETAQTYVLDGPQAGGFVLRVQRGVRSLTAVGIAQTDQPDTGGTYTTVTPAEVLLRPSPIDLPLGWPPTELHISRTATTITRWPTAQNGVKLTGNFGFLAIPKDIEAVAIDATVAAYASRKNGASSVMGADGTALPPWSLFFGRGSPQRGTLDRYRVYSV
jgi:hypothetical protein